MVYTDKEFAKCIKRYFVDVSARTITDAFFNVADNVVILCNSSSNKAKAPFGDRLTNFCVGELSFHVIKFIDTAFLDEFKRIFKIPSDCVYMVNVVKLNTLINKNALSELKISNEYGILEVLPPETEYSSDKHDVGKCIYDFHILDILTKWYNYIVKLNTVEHKSKYPHVAKVYDYPRPCNQNYVLRVDLTEFGDVFKNYHDSVNYIAHDGLSHPSIKSFVPVNSKLYEYIWSADDSIFIMFGYTDDVVNIRSIRPNVRAIPMQKFINFDNSVTDFKYE